MRKKETQIKCFSKIDESNDNTSLYDEIPSDWHVSILKNLCVQPNGVQTGPFGSQLHQKDYKPYGTPIITVEHLGENRIIHHNLPRISDDDRERLARYNLKIGDIVFSRVGSVDRRAIVRREENGWLFSGRCLRVRPDLNLVDPGYLSWFFGLPAFKEHIRQIAVGATMPSLNTNLLSNVEVILPPLTEQRAIASILNSLDDKIALNRSMNSTLEAIGQALFRRWFVDFEFPDGDGRPYKSSGGEMVEMELGEVPKGWRVGVFRDCCKRIENGGTPKRNEPKYWEQGTIPWLISGEVRKSIVVSTENFISNEGLSNSSAKLWPSGTTVVALYGATAGQVCFLAEEMCANQACCGLIPSEKMRFYIYLRASLSIDAFERQTRGSAQQNLSQQIMADFPTIIPDYGILERFDKAVEPIFNKWISNLSESRTLTSIRDTLLPKLMSGEIRMKIR